MQSGWRNRQRVTGNRERAVYSLQLSVISSMVLITEKLVTEKLVTEKLVRQCGLGGFHQGATDVPVRVTGHC